MTNETRGEHSLRNETASAASVRMMWREINVNYEGRQFRVSCVALTDTVDSSQYCRWVTDTMVSSIATRSVLDRYCTHREPNPRDHSTSILLRVYWESEACVIEDVGLSASSRRYAGNPRWRNCPHCPRYPIRLPNPRRAHCDMLTPSLHPILGEVKRMHERNGTARAESKPPT